MVSLPFADTAPTKYIWVSTSGSNSASGSASAPLKTIQAAIDKATPGTAIMVKAGTYNGSLDLSGLHGTSSQPISLVSADGQGAAKIVGGSGSAAINANKISYVGIYDFHVVSNTSSGDIGGFKLYGAWDNPARNIVISGNTVSGKGEDGIKLFNGARDILVVGNTIDGAWREEALDNVSVKDVTFAYNTIKGSFGYTGLTVKTGSHDIDIVGNHIDGAKGSALFIGGFGNSHITSGRGVPAEYNGFDAARVHAEGNVFGPNLYTSVSFIGAKDSVLEGNYIGSIVRSQGHREESSGKFHYHSFNNKIINNTTAKSDFFKPDSGETNGYTVSGNSVGSSKPAAGAGHSGADRFGPPSGGSGGGPQPSPEPEQPPPGLTKPSVPGSWPQGAATTKTINGSSSANSLTGSSAHELIDGKGGDDTMKGLGGDDRYAVGSPGDKVVEDSGQGVDTADVSYGTYTLPSNVENIVVKASSGTFTGNSLNNLIAGGSGSEALNGGGGHDRITGGSGADKIRGDSGNDLLTGGDGTDIYFYRSKDDLGDIITDFKRGSDKLDLRTLTGSLSGEKVGFAKIDGDLAVTLTHDGETEVVAVLDGVTASSMTFGTDLLV